MVVVNRWMSSGQDFPQYDNIFLKISHLTLFSIKNKTCTTMAEERKQKKTSILDLSKYMDKAIRVKFSGGREVAGVLKGIYHSLTIKTLIFMWDTSLYSGVDTDSR